MDKKFSLYLYLLLSAAMILIISCSSNMTMQTAKALPEGTIAVGGAFVFIYENAAWSQYSGRPDLEPDDDSNDDGGPALFPWLTLRYGLGGGADIGFNITFYAAEGYFKYQFLHAGDFSMASGIGAYYGYVPDLVDPEPGIHSYDFIFPLYISYDLTAGYSLYASGKYTIRNLYSRDEEKVENEHLDNSPRHIISVTIGNKIKYSEEYDILFELCVSRDIGLDYFSSQFTLGFSKEY